MLYSADFETTVDPNDCRVWAWGVCEIGKPEHFEYGNNIDGFIDFCKKSKNSTFYFHNERFDGEFLFAWLFRNGFKHTKEKHEKDTKTFNTLISDKGLFYSIEIIFEKKGKKYNSVKIYDSLKIIPFSVDEIAKAFGLPINKLKIDYKEYREEGHELSDTEIAYLRNDVEITARALHVLFDQGLTKMTQGANALEDYKLIIGKRNFERWFPSPDLVMDGDLRQCYKGGFTYANPIYREKSIGEGLVFDVNSLYPWVMHDCPLPYGNPLYFEGEYKHDNLYPLYIQMFECHFEIKKNHIPTVQIKHGGYSYIQNEYLTTSICEEEPEPIVMCMTSVDLKLFLEHYDTYNLRYINGWKFKASPDMFKPYVQKWMQVKIDATREGNKGMRTLSKLMLNSLYGKFGVNPKVGSKFPYDLEGKVKYETGKVEFRDALYIPVAAFVTAWARDKTIRTAQKLYKYFVYADTDSVHLRIDVPQAIRDLPQKKLEKLTTQDLINYGMELPDDFEVDPVALGAWKLESCFNRARFLRQKCYIEDSNHEELWEEPKYSAKSVKEFCEECGLNVDEELSKFESWYDRDKFKITCAGMPTRCYGFVNWENFRINSSYKGKLTPSHVKGGIVLEETIFTIRPA